MTRPPMLWPTSTTFFAQASANKRNSVLLALFVVAILGLLGFAIGYGVFGGKDSAEPARVVEGYARAATALGVRFVEYTEVFDQEGGSDVTDPTERRAYASLVREATQRGWWATYENVLGSGQLIGLA